MLAEQGSLLDLSFPSEVFLGPEAEFVGYVHTVLGEVRIDVNGENGTTVTLPAKPRLSRARAVRNPEVADSFEQKAPSSTSPKLESSVSAVATA